MESTEEQFGTPTLAESRVCKSCCQPGSDEKQMLECDVCNGWEHRECAGLDEEIKQPLGPYSCKTCVAQQGPSNNNLLQVPDGKRSTRGSKTGSKMSSKRGKKSLGRTRSTTSSARMAMLEEQLKLIEEEKQQKELDLLEQEAIKKRQIEAEERQLEEKRVLQQRKFQEELETKRQQQRIRQESFEKHKGIMRQVAETSSRAISITNN